MDPAAPRGEADHLARFRRLTTITVVATVALILIGGIVRVSDSGLGCGPAGSGTQGWPLCEGGVLPAGDYTAFIEFSHRVAATIVGVLILALVVIALRNLRRHRLIVRGSIAAGVLVLAQAALGGLTVEEGLHEYLVAAHLGLAMLLLALLLALRRLAQADAGEPSAQAAQGGSRVLRVLTVSALALVLATIVAGGLVAGTEGEGKPTEPVLGAHLACGEQFPTCLDRFMPFGLDRLVDIQLTHRLFMYLAAIAVVAMAVVAARQRAPNRAFYLAPAVLAVQILLGALNVWLGEHAGLIVAHLAVGTLLWGVVVVAAASLVPVSAPADDRVRRAQTATGAAAA
jgi:heme A synthase